MRATFLYVPNGRQYIKVLDFVDACYYGRNPCTRLFHFNALTIKLAKLIKLLVINTKRVHTFASLYTGRVLSRKGTMLMIIINFYYGMIYSKHAFLFRFTSTVISVFTPNKAMSSNFLRCRPNPV